MIDSRKGTRSIAGTPKDLASQIAGIIWTFFACYLILFCIASFLPDSFLWGVNHLAFVSIQVRALVILLTVVLVLPLCSFRYIPALERFLRFWSNDGIRTIFLVVVAGIGSFFFFYVFRIATDMYGDSRTILAWLAKNTYTFADLLNTRDNEPLTRLIHQRIALALNLDQSSTYMIVSAFCGGCFVASYVYFALTLNGSTLWKAFVLLMGLTLGSHQLFFGHVEDYTPIYLFLMMLLMLGWWYFEGKKTLALMVLIFIFGFRLHTEMILLLPALLYVLALHFKDRLAALSRWLAPARVRSLVMITLIVGIALYFLYFKAYRLETIDQQERIAKIFIPIVNPLPDPHSYSMFSIDHISDIIQQFLFTVSPAVILVGAVSLFLRKRITWAEPRVIFFLLAALYFVLFDMAVNPLLSMPRDWDFLGLAGAPLLFLAVAVSKHNFELLPVGQLRLLTASAVAASVLSCSIFFVNAYPDAVGRRLQGIGKWAFKSYYWGTAYIINVGEKSIPDKNEEIAEREHTIQQLLPYCSSCDYELGLLYSTLGTVAYSQKQFQKAGYNYEKAFHHDSTNATAMKGMALSALFAWDYNHASEFLDFYNLDLNQPDIVDINGLIAAEDANYVRYLDYVGADSAFIQKKLDAMYESVH